jgi:hypothetical protein
MRPWNRTVSTHSSQYTSRDIPLLARAQLRLAAAVGTLHYAVDVALCRVSALLLPGSAGYGVYVPMACLYSPYSCNRVADGGFCEPVRILLTVLSAWLKTRSSTLSCQHSLLSVGPRSVYEPTESDITSAPPPAGGSCMGCAARKGGGSGCLNQRQGSRKISHDSARHR